MQKYMNGATDIHKGTQKSEMLKIATFFFCTYIIDLVVLLLLLLILFSYITSNSSNTQ